MYPAFTVIPTLLAGLSSPSKEPPTPKPDKLLKWPIGIVGSMPKLKVKVLSADVLLSVLRYESDTVTGVFWVSVAAADVSCAFVEVVKAAKAVTKNNFLRFLRLTI